MIGIVHHAGVVLSVLLDREFFKKESVTEDDVKDGSWKKLVADFASASAGSRDRVLFIEKVDCVQKMLAAGFESDKFKIVVYDSGSVLSSIDGINIVDAKLDGDTWSLYKLLPPRFNEALQGCDFGVVGDLADVDVAALEPQMPTQKAKARKPATKVNSDLGKADAVMSSILSDIPPDPESEESDTDEPDPDLPTTEDVEVAQAVEDIVDQPDPEPAPKPTKKKRKKKVSKKAAKKPEAKKPPAESHKLF